MADCRPWRFGRDQLGESPGAEPTYAKGPNPCRDRRAADHPADGRRRPLAPGGRGPASPPTRKTAPEGTGARARGAAPGSGARVPAAAPGPAAQVRAGARGSAAAQAGAAGAPAPEAEDPWPWRRL